MTCPTCGCRLYREVGECAGSLAVAALRDIRDRIPDMSPQSQVYWVKQVALQALHQIEHGPK